MLATHSDAESSYETYRQLTESPFSPPNIADIAQPSACLH
jgi:hypothetical protein